MTFARVLAVSAALALALSACESGIPFVRKYDPVQQQVSAVCVKKNDRVIVKGFHLGMMRALEAHGIEAREYTNAAPADCPITLTYLARSSWDLRRYTGLFEVTVLQNGQQVGWMKYNARNAGKDPAKFDTPQKILTPMVKALFPNN